MDSIIHALRNIVGQANFYVQMGYNNTYQWDYGAMIEYFCAVLILCIVISSVFKFLSKLISK